MRPLRTILILLSCPILGCGYRDYMDRFEDSLSLQDYNEKVEQTLGPEVRSGPVAIRLPKQAPATPAPAAEVPEEVAAIFQSAPGSPNGFKLVAFVSRNRPDKPIMTIDQLEKFILEPGRIEQWMGPGYEMEENQKRAKRDLKSGPRYKTKPQETVAVQMLTVKQSISNEADANRPPEEYLWPIFFIDRGDVRAALAFRVRKAANSALAEPIDMSVTTVSFPAVAAGSRVNAAATAKSNEAKAATDGRPEPAAKPKRNSRKER